MSTSSYYQDHQNEFDNTTYFYPQSGVVNVPSKKQPKRKNKNTTDETIKYLISRIIALNYLLNRIDGIRDELKEIEEIALSLHEELNK